MGKSIINNEFEYDEQTWIVTVLNTGSKFGGHSIIVVEGLKTNSIHNRVENFIGQYDIKFTKYAIQDSSFNTKGYVSSVDIFENTKSERHYGDHTAKSYCVDAGKAQEMILSIKKDQDKIHQLNAMITNGSVAQDAIDSVFIKQYGFLEYQLIGKSSVLADEGAGDNCAGWTLAKLAVAGIGDGNGKPIPQKAAGGVCHLL